MFPLQQGNEMVIEFSRSPHHHKISQDLNILNEDAHHPHHASLDIISFSDKKLQGSTNTTTTTSSRSKIINHGNCNNDFNKKKSNKIVHREIERQRRQEMASLYASLRSLLPLEFIKGKRSIADHMNEAVNYIKHLEKNIKELSAKRDKLKKLSNNSSNPETHDDDDDDDDDDDEIEKEEDTSRSSSSFFSVHEINNNNGVGIELTCDFRDKRLPLSRLLQLVLQEEGLEVVNCVSTQVNGRFILSVQCEVNNNSDLVDLPALRRKIADVVPSFRCSD